MRRNELRTAKGYIEALLHANQDCHWFIEGIVTPEISEDGKTATFAKEVRTWNGNEYVKEERPSHRFSSDNNCLFWDPSNFPHCFGWQDCQFEDSYHGQMLFPLDGKEYLLIGFNA